ncbi:hypothetical protein [Pseudoroseicyclus aestuarii]|uniref:Beta-barrel assembly complex subunit BamF n=1 Tax=Pseudoroseicyclus aestuarii TaxID=1795041 RepID=A0A318ST46_9RHOB|nr:hypothetical protein [Pseudoroseicyclus aestuarii]PYE82339.1 hypothetical protein DFP88_10492 [Pseudoroseicyclus aestuarii]
MSRPASVPVLRLRVAACLLPLLAGCASFPALDARIPAAERAAPYPDLVDIAPLIARSEAAAQEAADPAASALPGRAEALRARAGALRARPVLSAPEAARLSGGVALPPALR